MTADFIREQIQHTGISESIKLARANEETASAFESFLAALRLHVSVSISEEEAAEMLVQHILTKPVFDALFHSAVCRHHPVSQALDKVAGLIESMNVPFNAGKKLPEFYDKVRRCAAGADSAAGKQKMIIELYDQFFKTAFPKMSARLGIVYTPLEVVDFILHSVDYVLRKDFGGGFNAEGNEILDPFTGTGIFIVRLLQSGLIAPENLRRKYENEIRAHEIVLLAYYIAAVNIDNAFREMISGSPQLAAENGTSFPGLILADTFTLTQNGQHAADKNSKRIKKHQDQPVRIIIGNPPYSAGQKSANDNN
jgi:predicted helicase